jgi:hypothetical protein
VALFLAGFARFGVAFFREGVFLRGAFRRGFDRVARGAVRGAAGVRGVRGAFGAAESIFGSAVGMSL